MLIGISGKKHVGKDTFTRMVCDILRRASMAVYTAAFADPLKRVASNISGIPLNWFHDEYLKEQVHPCCGKSPRKIMEEANSVFKECCGDDVFVRTVDRFWASVSPGSLVVSDVRFEVEADWVRIHGGHVVHITRDTGLYSSALSEQGVKVGPKDFIVINDAGLSELNERAGVVVSEILKSV